MEKEKAVLIAKWSKREKDIVFKFPRGCDGHYLNDALCGKRHHYSFIGGGAAEWVEDRSIVDELKARGYDITTLKFSIDRLPDETHCTSDAPNSKTKELQR